MEHENEPRLDRGMQARHHRATEQAKDGRCRTCHVLMDSIRTYADQASSIGIAADHILISARDAPPTRRPRLPRSRSWGFHAVPPPRKESCDAADWCLKDCRLGSPKRLQWEGKTSSTWPRGASLPAVEMHPHHWPCHRHGSPALCPCCKR